MSLEAIAKLRRAGKRPTGPVWIVLGGKPRWLDDDASAVIIRDRDEPQFMDWRPLLGLTVAVFVLQPNPQLTMAVLEAVQPHAEKFFGVADPSGTYPMLIGADEQHHRVLRSAWEGLCR